MIFVDTGAWFASVVPEDPHHTVAREWFGVNRDQLLTSDAIVDELLTVLKARGNFQHALIMVEELLQGNVCTIEWVTEEDISNAWSFFRQFSDKEWSFTDCVSKAMMERLDISMAASFDHHFRQFGTVNIVPVV